jgi:hypothetical protein
MRITPKTTHKVEGENHIFTTTIEGVEISRTFTKDSFGNIGKRDVLQMMRASFVTFVNTWFRVNLVLEYMEE